jgi:adenylate cyclase
MHLSSAKRIPKALRLIEQAIARDPRYGPALGWAAFLYHRLIVDGRSKDPGADCRKGIDFARQALEVAGDEPGVLTNAATALASFGEDIGAMIALIDRALMLNPSFARGWHFSGVLRVWAGQPDIAIEHVKTALRLSPRARVGTSLFVIGGSHFLARRFDEAVPNLILAMQDDPSFPLPYRWLAACYAHMGRLEEARQIVERLRSVTPVVMTSEDYLRRPEDRALFVSGLRMAAGEQT